MDLVIDFLVGNYMWFLVITIILIFSLIGYIVDSKEHKEVSIFDSPQELAKNLELLAASAQNKTIGDAMRPQATPMTSPMNTIEPMGNSLMNGMFSNSNYVGNQTGQSMMNFGKMNENNSSSSFDVLNK